ncbi:MAG: NUDIX domain-containing protein [Magnetococcales bacterium]|nr:NUDIX domain-containing protein [Magnetococcales bacterium]MBF0438793.1 NUDIX domain-containing protein [Magnetococcales bacterium]
MSEWLHATDPNGNFVKIEERVALLKEIRDHSRLHGEAPLAVPVVHIILLTSDRQIRMVQRGNKPENPFLWDKAVGGHVVTSNPRLSQQDFDDNARKEMAEEIGLNEVIIAQDDWHYHQGIQSGTLDLQKCAIIRRIDYDPWQGSVSRVQNGEPWLKRHNVVVYAGVFDGPFQFIDGEALDHRLITRAELMDDLLTSPWKYADGARIFMQRYYHKLR